MSLRTSLERWDSVLLGAGHLQEGDGGTGAAETFAAELKHRHIGGRTVGCRHVSEFGAEWVPHRMSRGSWVFVGCFGVSVPVVSPHEDQGMGPRGGRMSARSVGPPLGPRSYAAFRYLRSDCLRGVAQAKHGSSAVLQLHHQVDREHDCTELTALIDEKKSVPGVEIVGKVLGVRS